MGELLDALNTLDERGPPAEPINPLDHALDRLSRWTRQAPLQALAVAFLVGVLFTRRRR
jgi:hypothetical protein